MLGDVLTLWAFLRPKIGTAGDGDGDGYGYGYGYGYGDGAGNL